MSQFAISPFDLIDMSKSYKEITDLYDLLLPTLFLPMLTECEKVFPPMQPYERVRLKEIEEKLEQYNRSYAELPYGVFPFIAYAGPTEKWIVSVLIGLLPGREYALRGRGREDVDATNAIYFLNSLQNRVPLF